MRAEDVERLGGGQPEAAALAGCEPPEAVVAAELAPVLPDDRALLRLEPVPAEERAVVVAGEEARLLALRLASCGEARALGLGARRPLSCSPSGKETRVSCRGSRAASM